MWNKAYERNHGNTIVINKIGRYVGADYAVRKRGFGVGLVAE